jgi:hypothetical protein
MSLFKKLRGTSDKKVQGDWEKQKKEARMKRAPSVFQSNILQDIQTNIMLEDSASNSEEPNSARRDDKKMPSADEVNAKFEKLLKYRGISGNDRRRKAMMSKPIDEKWKLILIHQASMLQQENSFKITGAPEYYIHVLKEAPTRESLQELCKMLKTKPEEWIKKFLDLEGLSTIFAVLVATSEAQAEKKRQHALLTASAAQPKNKEEEQSTENKKEDEENEDDEEKSESEEEKVQEEEKATGPIEDDSATTSTMATRSVSAPPDPFDLLQAECIRAFRTLMNTSIGMNAFLKSRDKSVELIARLLDSENLKTKTQVFFLLATICVNSEDGFWLSLDAVNHFKLMKREKTRFHTIVNALHTRDYNDDTILLMISILMFFNALLSATIDASAKRQLKAEFTELNILSICDTLKADDIDDTLMIQIATLEDEMLEVDDNDDVNDAAVQDMDNLENPMEILKLIRLQLSGTNAFEHFVSILQLFLVISSKSNEKEKTNNMATLAKIIKKAINIDEKGKVDEISVKELQLQDRVQTQQKKIQGLEDKFLKLAMMIQEGKVDNAAIQKLIASTSKQAKERQKEMEELEKSGEIDDMDEILSKIKPPSVSMSDNLQPGEYKTHVKNLEAEIKFLSYKLKQAEQKAKSGGGGGSGGVGGSNGGGEGMGGGGDGSGSGGGFGGGSGTGGGGGSGMGGPPPPPGVGAPIEGGPPPPPPPPVMGGPPPPPPPPGMGGPPPPPPPPGMGGPPPPPGMGGMGMYRPPPLPNVVAKVPMKGIFWNKVAPNNLQESIWIKKDIVKNLESIELDLDELTNLFAQKTDKGPKIEKEAKPQKISLVDPKKAQNAAITLGSMRLPYEEIRDAILEMDERKLSVEQVKALKDMAPTPDEIEAIKTYEGEYEMLGPTEQFFTKIIGINRFEHRMNVWMFKMNFGASTMKIQPDMECVVNCCKEIMNSEKLTRLLEVILAVGNFINSAAKKAVHGIEMSSLAKLKDHKATGAKTDLLTYIILFIEKQYPDVLKFYEDFNNLEAVQRVSIPTMESELKELRAGINQVASEIDKFDYGKFPQDQFRTNMIMFLDEGSEKCDYLEKLYEDMNKKCEQLRTLFAEDKKKYKPEVFFANLYQFVLSYKESHGEILRKREAEERKAEREKKKLEQLQTKGKKKKPEEEEVLEKKKPKKTVMNKNRDGDSEGLLDQTLDELAGGNFKRGKAAAAKSRKKTNEVADEIIEKMELKKKEDDKPSSPSGRKPKRRAEIDEDAQFA